MERTVRNCKQVFAQPCLVEKALVGCSAVALLALVLCRGNLSKGVRLGLGLGAVSVLSVSFVRMCSFSLLAPACTDVPLPPPEVQTGEPTPLTEVQRDRKRAKKNLWKALQEHDIESNGISCFESNSDGSVVSAGKSNSKSDLGMGRQTNEDAHLEESIGGVGDLWGVFDGHGDRGWISGFIRDHIGEALKESLEEHSGCYVAALESAFKKVHEKVAPTARLRGGSTACLCFRPEGTNDLYTATLADTEAFLLRKREGEEIQWIPLSCVRNWCSKEDEQRAKLKASVLFDKGTEAKHRRVAGLNVSRAIGDTDLDPKGPDERVISVKPKVSVISLQPGDRLMMVCDGVTDFPPEDGLEAFAKGHWEKGPGIVDELISACKDTMARKWSGDNITVVYQEFDAAE